MFDNLKKKLGKFRNDAEEAAEENVEPVSESESDAEDLEPPSDAPTDPDTTGEGESEVPSESESEVSGEAADEVETAAPTAVGGVETAAEPDVGAAEPDVGAAEPDAANGAADTEIEPVETETDAALSETDTDVVADPDADAEAVEATDELPEPDAENDTNSTGFGRKARSLVRGKFVIEESDLEGPLHELELALLSSDVEMGVAEEILDNIREELIGETRTFTTSTGEVVENALQDAIYDVISIGQFDFDERIAIEDKPVVIIFTGVNGVGKTTSIAKLSRYLEDRGYSSVLANGDTYRAGANQQIREHAEALDRPIISHEQGGDPAAVLYDAVEYAQANDVDVVLGDTAGRLHTDQDLMAQLEKIDRVVEPDMTLFVDEAVAGQDAVNRARTFDEAATIDGAILTKADADSNGGAAISIAHVTGKPVLFLGVGQEYDDLERFDPDEMVDRLLERE